MGKHGHFVIPVLTAMLLGSVTGVLAAGRQVVVAEALKDAVRAHVARTAPASGTVRELCFRSVPDSIRVEGTGYALHVEPGGSARHKGVMSFVIAIECGGTVVHRCVVTAMIRTYADLLVAARTLAGRATLSAEDVRVIRMETTFVDRTAVPDPASLVGKRTRRLIAQGNILYDDQFEPIPDVLAGDRVRVLVRAGGVSVSTEGVAREDGHRGDVIDVSVQGRGERLKAKVHDQRTVAIQVE